jgi:hypothetical protein
MVQYIEHIFRHSVNVGIDNAFRCVGKKWLPESSSGQAFLFWEGLACFLNSQASFFRKQACR